MAIAVGAAPLGAQKLPQRPLPLGAVALPETRSVERIAPGLHHHHIVRGSRADQPGWAIALPPALTKAEVARAVACLAALGLPARQRGYRRPGSVSGRYHVVAGGRFATQAAARQALPMRPARDCDYSVRSEAGEAEQRAGPWSIHVLELDPAAYRGRLFAALGNDVAAAGATTSAIARHHGALAAVNGGYFVIEPEDGTPGEAAGLAVIDGRLRSEAVAGRHYLLLEDGVPVRAGIRPGREIGAPSLRWSNGRIMLIDGIDRPPGVIRNCGLQGARPTAAPAHDLTCAKADELILVTPGARLAVPAHAARFALDAGGGVARLRPADPSPIDDLMLVATGARIAPLDRLVDRRLSATVDLARLGRTRHAINGGPLLMRDGRPVRDEAAEGWEIERSTPAGRRASLHNWVNRRNPRTAAGITRDGRIIFLAVDGRGYERPPAAGAAPSVGMTIDELRAVLAHLGASEALNLDGGGSTTVVLNNAIRNRPSDPAGERKVGDAILMTSR